MSRRTTLLVIALAASLVLSGCAGLGSNDAAPESGEPQIEADGAERQVSQQSAATAGGGGDGGSADQSEPVEVDQQDRAIVKEGSMTVEVDNFSTAREAITSEAQQMGGFVGESNERLERDGDQTRRTGYVVVRVPTDEYAAMQDAVGDQGTVVNEQTETTDVSDQLVDLEARIDNLEQRRDRLRTFYDRANDTEELLRIEEELSEVQGEIERLQAQKRSLERRVAYSTLRVEIREPAPSGSVETQYHERSLVATFLGSVEDMYVLGRALLVTAAGLAPWLLPFAVPIGGLYWAFRSGKIPLVGPSKSAKTDASTGETAPAGEDVEPPETEDGASESDQADDDTE